MASARLKLYWFTFFTILFFFTGYMMFDIFLREHVLRRVLMIVTMCVHLTVHLCVGLLFEDTSVRGMGYNVEYRDTHV